MKLYVFTQANEPFVFKISGENEALKIVDWWTGADESENEVGNIGGVLIKRSAIIAMKVVD